MPLPLRGLWWMKKAWYQWVPSRGQCSEFPPTAWPHCWVLAGYLGYKTRVPFSTNGFLDGKQWRGKTDGEPLTPVHLENSYGNRGGEWWWYARLSSKYPRVWLPWIYCRQWTTVTAYILSTTFIIWIDCLRCGFTSDSTQKRLFRRCSPSQPLHLVWRNKPNTTKARIHQSKQM